MAEGELVEEAEYGCSGDLECGGEVWGVMIIYGNGEGRGGRCVY